MSKRTVEVLGAGDNFPASRLREVSVVCRGLGSRSLSLRCFVQGCEALRFLLLPCFLLIQRSPKDPQVFKAGVFSPLLSVLSQKWCRKAYPRDRHDLLALGLPRHPTARDLRRLRFRLGPPCPPSQVGFELQLLLAFPAACFCW